MAGVIPSPNIWHHPGVYEIENRSVDPDGVIEAAMRSIRSWEGAAVLDIGCGTGFHLPRFAAEAASVIGVEPHPPLVQLARRRIAAMMDDGRASGAPSALGAGDGSDSGSVGGADPVDSATRSAGEAESAAAARSATAADLRKIDIRLGTAQKLPVPKASIDVVHARWAYFFGPGCEPGLAEIRRVLRPGGIAFVIDNDATRSTFGTWFRQWLPSYDPAAVETFWARQGWSRRSLDIRWEMPTREEFEAVVRIEFSREHADRILASHPGSSVDYAVNLLWYQAPKGLWLKR
ncbi:class I SAM-dependent methyltransferase [Kineosporia babensis]|uniref:Class I SAM-dependent methyltransferase n=1 Tax=Kineosporia babensis TaxID=499548 RepID=A0A9X1SVS2_9ACTN|nr:class I SAM-dependent methyltransferase [Kineosporia babensis]MCD5313180.1 class I SAM-dependent methyltransferase [Kineosporia babensis]